MATALGPMQSLASPSFALDGLVFVSVTECDELDVLS